MVPLKEFFYRFHDNIHQTKCNYLQFSLRLISQNESQHIYLVKTDSMFIVSPKIVICKHLIQTPHMGHAIFKHCVMRNILIKNIRHLMCGNYIVHPEKYKVLPNQGYFWCASMDFLYFFTNYKEDHRLENTIKFGSLVLPTFEKIGDLSMHNVYWDTQ